MNRGGDDINRAFMRCLEGGDLEAAVGVAGGTLKSRASASVARLIAGLYHLEVECRAAGEIREANRLKRRRRALLIFCDHGLDVDRLLATVRLSEGYEGKFLLLTVSGGAAGGRMFFRGGDEWHREILRNAREEVADLGLSRARVDAAGGGWVRCEDDGAISISGGSEEFGACDRHLAADMLRAACPQRAVRVIE